MARPAKPENELHLNRVSVYLTDEDHAFILQLAARKGIPKGVLARSLLVAKLDQLAGSLTNTVQPSLSK